MKKKALLYWGIAAALLLGFFFYWLCYWRHIAYTDDAYVEGNRVFITPLRPGFVKGIYTDDTFLVEKGQLLVELDETDSEIAFDTAKEDLANAVREVCGLFHQVDVYSAEIEMKQAEYVKTVQDYEHREDVIQAGGVSLENFEHATAALLSNFYSLQMSQMLYQKSLALVQGTIVETHPMVLAAADRVRETYVQLYRCKIYAPVKGIAAQRTIQVGMWVKAGDPLMSVIPLDQIWVNANYKETQMKHMRIGQPVKITSDLYGGDVVFRGKIVGLPGGAGNAFSLLPPQNLSGNWIKIVQRLPVRVALDPEELLHFPLRIGLSMEAIVDLRDSQGGLVPTSNKGSPVYKTEIFDEEERGDEEIIEQIIADNKDVED